MTQALSALLRAPEATGLDRVNAVLALKLLFVTGFSVEEKGVKYGWLPHSSLSTMAEPSLWTTVLLSLLHSQRNLLDQSSHRESWNP